MTTLGAAIYFGFFVAAALWLFLTSDRPGDADHADGVTHWQDRSNPSSASLNSDGSRPLLASHWSLK
jgi:hypothetical protein